MTKRLFDIFFAAIGLIFLAPLFFIVAIALKLDSRGPIFFRQTRMGRHFQPFSLIKFRSMIVHDGKGLLVTAAGDTRITRVGRFIRKTKMDELPQLINVLRGDMSLVGPRPEVPKYVELRREDHVLILSVRPGITDWASIANIDEEGMLAESSDCDRTYRDLILPEKNRLQKFYVETRSFPMDLKILYLTVFLLISPRSLRRSAVCRPREPLKK